MVQGKELGGASRCSAWGMGGTAPLRAHCKSSVEYYFHFLPFFVKAKFLFGFLSVSKTGSRANLS